MVSQVRFRLFVRVGRLSLLVAVPGCLGVDDHFDALGHEHHGVGLLVAVVDICLELKLVVVVLRKPELSRTLASDCSAHWPRRLGE